MNERRRLFCKKNRRCERYGVRSPVPNTKPKPVRRLRFEKEEQGSGRTVLSIPREIESAGAKRTLLRRGMADRIRTCDLTCRYAAVSLRRIRWALPTSTCFAPEGRSLHCS